MTGDTVLSLWIIMLGPVLGSFVTALADRHCSAVPVLAARSRCTSCGSIIAPWDLVPLFSFATLWGRCRTCNAAMPRHVWFGEWAGLGCGVLAVVFGTSPGEQLLALVFLALLVGLFQSDLLCFRLPDMMTMPLLGVGIGLGAINDPISEVVLAAALGAGALWLIGVFYRGYRGRDGLGFGDVKLMSGLSAAVGMEAIPWVTLIAATTAIVTTVTLQQRIRTSEKIRFGCYLSVAGALVWLFG